MLKKKFLKGECQVTFELPMPEKVGRVNLVGDFNDWNTLSTLMDWKLGKCVITLDPEKRGNIGLKKADAAQRQGKYL